MGRGIAPAQLSRFDEVCRCLNLLLNHWRPTLRLIAKGKQASSRHKKI
jgi:hypothetical protein